MDVDLNEARVWPEQPRAFHRQPVVNALAHHQDQIGLAEHGMHRVVQRRVGIPIDNGWSSGTAPRAIVIVYSGNDVRSMKRRSASSACDHQTPLPAMRTGRSAARSNAIARSTSAAGGAGG